MSDKDRNSAMRVACSRARKGDSIGARHWAEIAEGFAPVSPRSRDALIRAIKEGSQGIPGQIRLEIQTDGR